MLFDRYRAAVWRFYRRRLPDPARAEELTHDVFVALLQNASRYQPLAAFRSYLFGIAYNLLLAERRRMPPASDDPADGDFPAAAIDLDAGIWVRRALATLEPDAREMVMLREYEQLGYQEIADLLGIPLNTVRSRLFRARLALKDALTASAPSPARAAAREGRA